MLAKKYLHLALNSSKMIISKAFLFFTTLLLVAILPSCNNLKEPEYRGIKNFRIENWGQNESTAKMDVIYYNPNATGFTIKNTDLDIYINDKQVGHTHQDSAIRVMKESEFIVPVSAKLHVNSLLDNALTALLNQSVNIKINGYIVGSKAGISKRFPVYYQGNQKIF